MLLGYVFAWIIVVSLGYLLSLSFPENLELKPRLSFSVGIGLGIISVLMMILGFLYNYKLQSVMLFLIPVYALLVLYNRKRIHLTDILSKSIGLNLKLVLILSIFSIASISHIILFPELYKDSGIYMQWTKLLYESKEINFVEGGPSVGMGLASNYPSAYQLITVFFYLFTGENPIYPRITSLILSVLFVSFVYEWSIHVFEKKKFGIYSSLILLSLPSIVFFSRSAAHYMYLTFQFSMACLLLKKYTETGEKLHLYLSSFFGGFAALAAYLGGIFLFIAPISLLNRNIKLSHLVTAGLIFSIIISPWYGRNFIVMGNPIWPMGGGNYIDPNIENHAFSQLNSASKVSGFNYDSIADLGNSIARLLFSYVNYSDASVYHPLNPFFILVIPTLFLWIKKGNGKMEFFYVWFMAILASYVLIFNYWSKYLILISVPTTFLFLYLKENLKEGITGKLIECSIVILFANALLLAFIWDDCPQNHTMESIIDNLGNHTKLLEICYGDDIRIAEWVNENLPENAVIATTDYKLYYYDRNVTEINSWKLRELYYTNGIEESIAVLKENGITNLVVTGDMDSFVLYPDYLKLIKEINGKVVYELL